VPRERGAGDGAAGFGAEPAGRAFPLQRRDDPDERAVPVPPSHASSLRCPAAGGGRPLAPGSPRAACSPLPPLPHQPWGRLHQSPSCCRRATGQQREHPRASRAERTRGDCGLVTLGTSGVWRVHTGGSAGARGGRCCWLEADFTPGKKLWLSKRAAFYPQAEEQAAGRNCGRVSAGSTDCPFAAWSWCNYPANKPSPSPDFVSSVGRGCATCRAGLAPNTRRNAPLAEGTPPWLRPKGAQPAAFVTGLALLPTSSQHLLRRLQVGEVPLCSCSFASNTFPVAFCYMRVGVCILGFWLKSEENNIWVLLGISFSRINSEKKKNEAEGETFWHKVWRWKYSVKYFKAV